jgi:nucleoside-diphosphate kinase
MMRAAARAARTASRLGGAAGRWNCHLSVATASAARPAFGPRCPAWKLPETSTYPIPIPAGACQAAGGRFAGTAALVGGGGSAASELSAAALAAAVVTASAASVAFASSTQERSFIMVKPDAVHRGLVGEVVKRFETKGYKLVGIKVLVPTKDLAAAHYAEHNGRPFFPKLVDFLSSGAVVAMVWEGKGVVAAGRAMIGATNPLTSAPGTLRGDLAIDVGRNIVHGSDGVDAAQREIALWFKPEELAADYTTAQQAWIYE